MKNKIVTLALLFWVPLGNWAQPQTSSALPLVVQHADPTYPPLARQTRISGDVHVEITTDGESVISAAAIDGHPPKPTFALGSSLATSLPLSP
jgi:hypothetical protein